MFFKMYKLIYVWNGSKCRCKLTNICGDIGGHHLHGDGIINLKVEPLFPGKKNRNKHTYAHIKTVRQSTFKSVRTKANIHLANLDS